MMVARSGAVNVFKYATVAVLASSAPANGGVDADLCSEEESDAEDEDELATPIPSPTLWICDPREATLGTPQATVR